jgi:hypothetical protein
MKQAKAKAFLSTSHFFLFDTLYSLRTCSPFQSAIDIIQYLEDGDNNFIRNARGASYTYMKPVLKFMI